MLLRYYVIDMGWYVPRTAFNASTSDVDAMQFSTDGHCRYTPDPERFPSSAMPGTPHKGTLADLCGRIKVDHGVLCGVHLVTGVPLKSVTRREPIANTSWTAADIAGNVSAGGQSWNLLLKRVATQHGGRALHPGAQPYYDSLVSQLVGYVHRPSPSFSSIIPWAVVCTGVRPELLAL